MGRKPQKADRPKVYTLTQEGIDKMVNNRVNERKAQYEAEVREAIMSQIDEQIRLSSDNSIKMFMLSLMENKIIGWRRIQPALEGWHEINAEFCSVYDTNSNDYMFAIDELDRRFELAVRHSTSNMKGGPVDIRKEYDCANL